MSTTLTLRAATHNDCRQLGQWNAALIKEAHLGDALNATQLESRMREWLASAQFRIHLFERENETVGYTCWGSHGAREVFIRQFYIVPKMRRQGIGRSALLLMQETIWPQQTRVSLRVDVAHRADLAFWHACGYADRAVTLERLPERQ
jgi:GNAT superfamily N-acetyltransferase